MALARRALDDAHGVGPGPSFSQSLIALAQARLGRDAEAAKTVHEIKRILNQLPGAVFQERLVRVQVGRMALDRREWARAVQELKQAEATLLPHPGGAGVGIWFALGSAYLASGNDAEAAARFQKIVDAGTSRVGSPLEFVRSLYFLGQIAERQGDRDKARAYYRRFVGYWGDGDIDRDRVADARKKLLQ